MRCETKHSARAYNSLRSKRFHGVQGQRITGKIPFRISLLPIPTEMRAMQATFAKQPGADRSKECHHLRLFFTENRDLEVVTTANRLVF